MILSDADAIRAGYPNIASYRLHVRRQAEREAEREAASAQARHMAERRARQTAGGGGSGVLLSVPVGAITEDRQRTHDAELAERRRLDALTRGVG